MYSGKGGECVHGDNLWPNQSSLVYLYFHVEELYWLCFQPLLTFYYNCLDDLWEWSFHLIITGNWKLPFITRNLSLSFSWGRGEDSFLHQKKFLWFSRSLPRLLCSSPGPLLLATLLVSGQMDGPEASACFRIDSENISSVPVVTHTCR